MEISKTSEVWAHPTAIIDNGARIGSGTKIWHFSHICGSEVSIGTNCSFGQNCYVGPRVTIGHNVRVQNNVSMYDLVEIEDFVFCGPSMVFTNVVNPRAHIPRKSEFKKTIVRRGATLGANCTVVCGIEIGRFAFIAAGAVVTKDVPEFALMMGVPAKRTAWMCHCGVQLQGHQEVSCASCGSLYRLESDACLPIKLEKCFEEK